MPLFALPIAHSSTSRNSRQPSAQVQFALPDRKRKRPTSERSSSEDDQLSHVENEGPRLTAASTNPLSLTPAEILQYRLAGLELDQELPSKSVKDFPHRALPEDPKYTPFVDNGKGKGDVNKASGSDDNNRSSNNLDSDGGRKKQNAKSGPRQRLQHISVLTTILLRCLQEGDIVRASRAWSMLIRTQVSGRGVDLRETGYWGIGAELLVRGSNQGKSDTYDLNLDEEEIREAKGITFDNRRWGSTEGLIKIKDYYERLILQHPYKRQFHGNVNALDFWPVMVTCEIYGIQYEQNNLLSKITTREDNEDGGERSSSQSEASDEDFEEIEEEDAEFTSIQRRKARRMRRREERRWVEKEETRKIALRASEKIAGRMDDVMSTPPYSDSHEMLRLRGMLALYIGDLSVPAKIADDDNKDISEIDNREPQSDDTKRRLLLRQRTNDRDHGKVKQYEEYERARKLFERIAKDGGSIEDFKNLELGQSEEQD